MQIKKIWTLDFGLWPLKSMRGWEKPKTKVRRPNARVHILLKQCNRLSLWMDFPSGRYGTREQEQQAGAGKAAGRRVRTGAGAGRVLGAALSRFVGLWTTRQAGRAGPVKPSSGGGEAAGGGGGGGS